MPKLTADPLMTILPITHLPAPRPNGAIFPGSLHFHIGYPHEARPPPAPAQSMPTVDAAPSAKTSPKVVGHPHKRAKEIVEKWRTDQQAAIAAVDVAKVEGEKDNKRHQVGVKEADITNIRAKKPQPQATKTIPAAHRPHPLLWVCLALSILALALGVSKGTLPTIMGRHKALRLSRYFASLSNLSSVSLDESDRTKRSFCPNDSPFYLPCPHCFPLASRRSFIMNLRKAVSCTRVDF